MKKVLLFVSLIAIALVAYGDNGGRRFTTVMSGARRLRAGSEDASVSRS